MRLFLICISMLLSLNLSSQNVAVVLSGGGAKGLAHIGVIKALEENNIPIDFITGTSIGAIIGSLYASGYTTEEMIELIKSDQFRFWATGKIEEQYQYFFKKHDDNASWLELKFRVEDSIIKPIVPTNIVPNHQMDLAFFYLYSQAAAVAKYDFDNLMIPFRCVATDVHENKAIVLRNGQLASAVRASMTYPFYFKPIKIENRLLFDGGMKNNFPIDVAINDFAPDYIIGSKVASNSKPPDEDDLYSQLENMLLGKTDYVIPDSIGILIEPEIFDVGLLDFQYVDRLVESGYRATLKKIEKIKNDVKREVSLNEIQQKRNYFKSRMPELKFDKIDISGLNSTQRLYTKNNLRLKRQIFSFSQFKRTYFRLVQDDIIKTIYPSAIYNDSTGYFDLKLNVKRDNKFQANFGGNISSTSLNQAFLGVQYKHLSKRAYNISANSYYGRFYGSAQIKGRIDFSPKKIAFNRAISPFYLELGLTHNRWDYFKSSSQLFFEDVRPSYLIQRDITVRTDIGAPISANSKLSIGAAIVENWDEYYQVDDFLKSDTADITTFNFNTYHITFEKNTLNYKQFANGGKYIKFSVRYVDGQEFYEPGSTSNYRSDTEPKRNHDYLQVKFKHDIYKKINKFYTIGINAELLFTSKFFFYNYTSTMLNSPIYTPIPHSTTQYLENYRSYTYAAFGIRNVFQINRYFDARLEGFYFQPYEKIYADQQIPYYDDPFKHQYFIGSASLVYHTLVGPVSLSLNYYEKLERKFYLLFNFGYTIFNKRALD
jgi:NTE family protein